MLPTVVDLKVTQGDSFAQAFRLSEDGTPVDLTGSTIEAELRNRAGERIPLVATADLEQPGVVVLGYVEIPPHGHYRWDLEVTEAGDVVRTWVAGRFDVIRDVTNEPA
jgi:hypothetical protein